MPRTDKLDYYVSIVRGGRRGLLAGPFDTHTEALSMVDAARDKACEVDSWAWFDLFGTCSLPHAEANPTGKLNGLLGIAKRSTPAHSLNRKIRNRNK